MSFYRFESPIFACCSLGIGRPVLRVKLFVDYARTKSTDISGSSFFFVWRGRDRGNGYEVLSKVQSERDPQTAVKRICRKTVVSPPRYVPPNENGVGKNELTGCDSRSYTTLSKLLIYITSNISSAS